MRLHDPRTEKEIIRIASGVAGKRGLERPDTRWWTNLASKITAFLAPPAIALFIFRILDNDPPPEAVRYLLCALMGMLLIRAGMTTLSLTAQKCGIYTLLVNLPVPGKIAYGYVRSRFLRKFCWVALIYSFVLSLATHRFEDPEATIQTTLLLFGITLGTVAFIYSKWCTRSKLVKIWHVTGSISIAWLFCLHFFGEGSLANTQVWIDHMLWIFPPAWVLPEKINSGGLILALTWIAYGLWSWIYWPSPLSAGYDKSDDFPSAYGFTGHAEEASEADDTPSVPVGALCFDPPLSPAGKGWVNQLIMQSIASEDRLVAGALLDSGKNWSTAANLSLILASLWLLMCWILKDHLPTGDEGEIIKLLEWVIPSICMILAIFPYSNSIQRATNPYSLGSGYVPFFSTLPVSIRALLRISQRVNLVRCVIFAVIATPFFWALAIIGGLQEIAAGLAVAIPAFTVLGYFSRPVFIWNRIQSSIKRRRGIFLLHFATASVEIALFILWLLSGFAGVSVAYQFGLEIGKGGNNGSYTLQLVAGTLVGIALSAVFSRIMLEIVINEVRHRRYDWVSRFK